MFLTWMFGFIGVLAFLLAISTSNGIVFSLSAIVAAGCFASLVVDILERAGLG